MSDIPRLNGAIRALEQGRPAFTAFATPEIGAAQLVNSAPFDAAVFDLEHHPYDVRTLRDCLQYMLNRAQILRSGSPAPAVTPMVRIPANGAEMNEYLAKQVLDIGVYGVIWPHVATVKEAHSAVAACRYARPPSAPYHNPPGRRGDAPIFAAPYWGLTSQQYYERADVWPLNPKGEILVGIMCEKVEAIRNLPKILDEVPGIGLVLIGEGDLSQELGFPRQYNHPALLSAIDDVLAVCIEKGVACGHPHVGTDNVEELLGKGFRWLMTAPTNSFTALEEGRRLSNRSDGGQRQPTGPAMT